eukprot:3233969-Pyramimonas_sp.AAC.1
MVVAQQARGPRDGETPLSEIPGAGPAEEPCDVEQVLKEARKSRNREQPMADRMADADGGVVAAGAAATPGDAAKWLEGLEFRVGEDTGRRVANAKLFEMAEKK